MSTSTGFEVFVYLCVWKCTLSAESFNTSRQSISRRAMLSPCLLLKDALHRVVRAKSREVNKTKPIVPSFVFFLFFGFCFQHLVLRVWVRVIFSGLSFWCIQMNNCWQFSGSVQLYIDSFRCFSFFCRAGGRQSWGSGDEVIETTAETGGIKDEGSQLLGNSSFASFAPRAPLRRWLTL